MIRIAKPEDPKKINDLKKKINDKEYLSIAIQNLALVITKEILHIEG